MQTAVRKRAADFDFWGDTPTPEFCENSHERGPRSPAGTAQGFDPPLGATPGRGGRGAAAVPESSGRRRTGGGVPRRARGGRFSPGRRGQGAVPGDAAGASGRGGRRARGGKAGAAPRCRGAADGGAGKTAAPSAACVGFQATSAIEAAGGRKSSFLPYKEALFSGRGSCQIRAVLRPDPCRFGRVAFSAAQSDECVTPGGAGEKPRRKTKRPSERSAPHEKPDFRYRD